MHQPKHKPTNSFTCDGDILNTIQYRLGSETRQDGETQELNPLRTHTYCTPQSSHSSSAHTSTTEAYTHTSINDGAVGGILTF